MLSIENVSSAPIFAMKLSFSALSVCACAPDPQTGVRPWSLALWLILPLWCLVWLWTNPPHAFDLAVERNFFADGGWPWHAMGSIEFWLHFMPKVASIVIFLCIAAGAFFALHCARAARARGDGEAAADYEAGLKRTLYALAAGLLCVTAVWWLKESTGVFCPWSVEAFGGKAPVKAPGLPFFAQPGRCWPSGAAGSGFCLLPAYFMLRDAKPRLAKLALLFAMASGLAAGIARCMTGAHFVSHVAASFLIDWTISALLYVLVFDRASISRKVIALLGPKILTASNLEARPGDLLPWGAVLFGTAAWWVLFFDAPMLAHLAGVGSASGVATASTLTLAAGAALAFIFISAALIELFALFPRRVCRGLLLVSNITGAAAFAALYLYGTTMTPDMVRNFIATDSREALGYLSGRSACVFLAALIPVLWLGLVGEIPNGRLKPGFGKAALKALGRTGKAVGLAALGVAVIGLNFQSFAGAMRQDKTLRYQIAPVNVFYSGLRTLAADASPELNRPRIIVDPAPKLEAKVTRPAVLVVVVGETARAQNWGLNGYARDTTPELKTLPVLNFPHVTACGTSTDVSLPCMMSRIGRSDYNRERILSEEQLPALLHRAGVNVLWVDNQSGCKGACAGVPTRQAADPKNCPDGECMDAALVDELKRELEVLPADRPTVLFLHMMGSHGPAYYRRSDDARKAFRPECTDADLDGCPRETVVNAYDNSIRYTDHVLAEMIRTLEGASNRIDAGLLYLSDHGESLGESGLFLHGAPWWMAPAEQTQVPAVFWMNDGWAKTFYISREKLRARASGEVTQESLWHTVLGLVNVKSTTYRPEYDLTR